MRRFVAGSESPLGDGVQPFGPPVRVVHDAPMRAPSGLDFSWLVQLRWTSIAGQVLTIGVTASLGIELPLAALAAVIAIEVATNVAATVLRRRGAVPESWVRAFMGLDVLFLTALLYLTGGPMNPFSFLYLVPIALAAVVLEPGWTWALAGLSLACFGALFVRHHPIEIPHADHMRLHLLGMWVAFGVAAAFIVHFLLRVSRALSARERELEAARSLASRHDKVVALATLAAGAAHELATPLATISVVATELGRLVAPTAEQAEDVQLIQSEVRRCREILDRMAAGAGETKGEGFERVVVPELARASLQTLAARPPVQLEITPEAAKLEMAVPLRALSQALRVLLKNAQDASGPDDAVVFRAHVGDADRRLHLEVEDHGGGMSREVLARAGEPFFTTKGPGRGMGLGLFLARTVIERLDGALEIDSLPERGTRVLVTLPVPRSA